MIRKRVNKILSDIDDFIDKVILDKKEKINIFFL